MIDRHYDSIRDVDKSHFAQLPFEDLESEPMAQPEHVYTSLELAGFARMRKEFQHYLDSVKNYAKGTHVLDDETVRKVDRHWGGLVEAWGYPLSGRGGRR